MFPELAAGLVRQLGISQEHTGPGGQECEVKN
jgi:hypothetical protein